MHKQYNFVIWELQCSAIFTILVLAIAKLNYFSFSLPFFQQFIGLTENRFFL